MTEASNAFTISGSRFKAEKAALAMYDYVIEHWSTLQEDGKVEVVDDAELGKGSYFSVSSDDGTSFNIDAKVNVIGPEKYTAILKATADNQSFDNLKVETDLEDMEILNGFMKKLEDIYNDAEININRVKTGKC